MSLLLDVSDLEREVGREKRFKLQGEGPTGLPEGADFGPLEVEGRALWTGRTVMVEGSVGTTADLVCGLCLAPFRMTLAARLVREFRQGTGAPGTALREEGDRPAGAEEPLPFNGEVIDLGFPAWEALVLELPMKPVCGRGCRGLCPVCGANLNETTCGCRAERADPRLLSLRRLLEDKERGE